MNFLEKESEKETDFGEQVKKFEEQVDDLAKDISTNLDAKAKDCKKLTAEISGVARVIF